MFEALILPINSEALTNVDVVNEPVPPIRILLANVLFPVKVNVDPNIFVENDELPRIVPAVVLNLAIIDVLANMSTVSDPNCIPV